MSNPARHSFPKQHLQTRRVVSAGALSFLLVFGQTAPLLANPTGGQVAAGAATISSLGPTETIKQSTSAAIINWQQFSINNGELTKFVLPNSSAATLNRVLGGNPSLIYGTLQSNGALYLVNPSGIVVGPSGRIDTASFLGSTLDVSDDDFLKRASLNFQGSSTAGVTNQGVIHASSGDVYLIAAQVDNSGTITAPKGNVGLAAGSDILYQPAGNQNLFIQSNAVGTTRAVGVTNSGTIKAATSELTAAGGNAYALAINNSGNIAASGFKKVNGQVYLTSGGGSITNSGTISAKNKNGNGGTIVVDGSGATSSTSSVTNSGLLDASATVAGGTGGSVTLKNLGGATSHTGTILAKGGQGGSGGNVDISGAEVKLTGTVDTTAPGGKTGNLLLDPLTLTVNSSGGDETGAQVAAILATTNLNLNADNLVTIEDNITWTSSNTLTLSTNNSGSEILIYSPISGVNGGLTLKGANDSVPIEASSSINVANFILQDGTWSQYSSTLPAFSATHDFEIQNRSTFFRVTGGSGESDDPYQITDIYGLQGLASPSGSLLGLDSELTNNIDATGTATWNNGAGFVPIGNATTVFNALFNGQSFTINGLTINLPNSSNLGLFGDTGAGSILENVTLSNVQISGSGSSDIGALAGTSNSSVLNAHSSGTVSGLNYVGGLEGYSAVSTTSSSSSATVSGGNYMGGLAGANGGVISNSSSSGSVTNGGSFVGGLVGLNFGSAIVNSSSSSSVTGTFDTGGLVGDNSNQITDSYSTGTVNGGAQTGGLVGQNSNLLTQDYSLGAVTASGGSSDVGGLVGLNDVGGTILNAYSTGSITAGIGSANVGGLVGSNAAGGTITSTYSSGAVSGGSGSVRVGGFVGNNLGTIASSFWDATTSGFSSLGIGSGTNTGVTGDTTTTLLSASTYATWNIGTTPASNTWVILNGLTRPMLGMEYSTTITNAHQLQLIDLNSTTLSTIYTLANNIDLSGTSNASDVWGSSTTNGGPGFTPIGNYFGTPYTGIFNGQGYTINGAYLNNTGSNYLGLFGGLGASALVENVGVTNAQVNGGLNVGALVGINQGTVQYCYSTGTVTAESGDVGGLVGNNSTGGVIEDSYNLAAVSGPSAVGGLVGTDYHATISNSYNSGAVSAGSGATAVGGLIGTDNSSTVTDVYNTGPVSVSYGTSDVGGLVGEEQGGSTITDAYSSGAITAFSGGDVGGLIGYNGGVTVNNSFWDTTLAGSGIISGVGSDSSPNTTPGVSGESTSSLLNESTYAAWNIGTSLSDAWFIFNGYTRPILSSEYSTTITNAHQLQLIGIDTTTLAANYTVVHNIDLSGITNPSDVWATSTTNGGAGFVPIGSSATPFTGTLNGQGYTINNLYINLPNSLDAGLFGATSSTATIEKVNLTNVQISGDNSVGGLAGFNYGVILNSSSTGAINGVGGVLGGLVGANDGGTITDSYSTATVTGATSDESSGLGGLVGYLDGGTVSNSYSTGAVTTTILNSNIGGLVGLFEGGTISGSYSTGAVTVGSGSEEVGGLVGQSDGVLSNDYSTGSVNASGSNYVGGLAGYATDTLSNSYSTSAVTGKQFVGGLVGYVDNAGLSLDYSTGPVNGTTYVGGLAGFLSGSVSNAYSTGSVTGSLGSTNVGGFAGLSGGTITNAYSSGAVSAPSGGEVGAFVGDNAGTITNSFWDTDSTGGLASVGTGASSGLTGATTLQLETQSFILANSPTTPTWDFTSAWTTNGGTTLPQLTGQPVYTPVLDVLSGTDFTGNGMNTVFDSTIDLIFNGSLLGSTTTDSSGAFSFNISATDLTGGILLTDASYNGNTFYQANSPASTIGGIDIVGGTLRVVADTASNSALGTTAGSLSGYGINYSVANGALSTTSGVNMAILSHYTFDGNITSGGAFSTGSSSVLTGSANVSITATSADLSGTLDSSNSLSVTTTAGALLLEGLSTQSGVDPSLTLNSTGGAVIVDNSTLTLNGGSFSATGQGFASTTQSTDIGYDDGVDIYNSTINASGTDGAGSITIVGTAGEYLNSDVVDGGTGVNIGSSTLQTNNSGTISITGYGSTVASYYGSSGVSISNQLLDGSATANPSTITAQNGLISIQGTVTGSETQSNADGMYGIAIQDGSTVQATGSGGAVSLLGDASEATPAQGNDAEGVFISGYDDYNNEAHTSTVSSAGDGLAYTANPDSDSEVSFYGIYIGGNGGSVTSNSGNNASADGVDVSEGANITGTGRADITIFGQGGTNTVTDSSNNGSAQGVNLSTDQRGSISVTTVSGNILLAGYGGATPSQGLGVLIAATNNTPTNQGTATVSTATGNIVVDGTGGSGYTGTGLVIGEYIPNAGIAVADYATVQTGGTGSITLNGTGGVDSYDTVVLQLPSGSYDNFPVHPSLTAGGALNIDTTAASTTGTYLNAVVAAASVTLGSGTTGDVTSITSGSLDIENSSITVNGGDFTAFGEGISTSVNVGGNPDLPLDGGGITPFRLTPSSNQNMVSFASLSGINLDRNGGTTTIDNTSGGNIYLTGEASTASVSAAGGTVAGEGVYLNNATLETTGAGAIGITGDASVGTTLARVTVQNILQGVELTSSDVQSVDGLISIDGTVNAGTAEATSVAASQGYDGDYYNGSGNGVGGVLIHTDEGTPAMTVQDTGAGAIAIFGDTTGSTSDASDTTATAHDNVAVQISGNNTQITSAGNSVAYTDTNDNTYTGIYIQGNAGRLTNNQLGGPSPTLEDTSSAKGVEIKAATIQGQSEANITIVGNGGTNSTAVEGAVLGGAEGVVVSSEGSNTSFEYGNTLVETDSGNITVTGVGGSSPTKGIGVVVAGSNGASTAISSTSGSITITGTGGSGNTGSGSVSDYLANDGITVADNATLQTGTSGEITLTGTGLGTSNAGVAFEELNSAFDSTLVQPTVITGTFAINTTSSTDIVIDETSVNANEAYLNASGAVGSVYLMGSSFVLTGSDEDGNSFVANGNGTSNQPSVDLSGTYSGPYGYTPIGVLVANTTIDARTGMGNISITGQGNYTNFGSQDSPDDFSGPGVSIQSSTLETACSGGITIVGHGGVASNISVQGDLTGVYIGDFSQINDLETDYGGSTLKTHNGIISITGDVTDGTSLSSSSGGGDGVAGIRIQGGSTVQSTGSSGGIVLFGDASGGTSDASDTTNHHDNHGVIIFGAGTTVSSAGDGYVYTDTLDNTYNGIYIQGNGGTINNNQEASDNSGASSDSGISILEGATVQGTGSSDLTLVGQAGTNNTLDGEVLGSSIGVNISGKDTTAPGNVLVSTDSGNITITGTAGTSPNAGIGVVLSAFDSGYTSKIASNSGVITITGTGATGNSGAGDTTYPNVTYGPNAGVVVLGASTIQTGGAGDDSGNGIYLTGTGYQSGSVNTGVLISQFGLSSGPTITSLNSALDISAYSSDLIIENSSLPESADINADGVSWYADDGISLANTYVTTDGGDFNATGNSGLFSLLHGIDVANSTIDAQGGYIILTGTANNNGTTAGVGVYLGDVSGPAILETTGTGGITVTGYGSQLSDGPLTGTLTGISMVENSQITVTNGNISLHGTVNNGTTQSGNVIGIDLAFGNNVIKATGDGTISLNGDTLYSTASESSYGVLLTGATISANNATSTDEGPNGIYIDGTAGNLANEGSDSAADGLEINGGTTISATGSAPITLTGSGGIDTNTDTTLGTRAYGVYIVNGTDENCSVTSTSGEILITGYGGASPVGSIGIAVNGLQSISTISSTIGEIDLEGSLPRFTNNAPDYVSGVDLYLTNITTETGAIVLDGKVNFVGSSLAANQDIIGVAIGANTSVTATGTGGSVSITGNNTGSISNYENYGVFVNNYLGTQALQITTEDGPNLTISGTAGTASFDAVGTALDSQAGPQILVQAGGGDIDITGTLSGTSTVSDELVGSILKNANVQASNGSIDLIGTVSSGTAGTRDFGVRLSEGTTLKAGGGVGAITITGTTVGSTSQGINVGVAVEGQGTSVSAGGRAALALTVTGTSGGLTGSATSVVIDSGYTGDYVSYAPSTDGVLISDGGQLVATNAIQVTGVAGANSNESGSSSGVAIFSPVAGEASGILNGASPLTITGTPGTGGDSIYGILVGGSNNVGSVFTGTSGLASFIGLLGGNINLNTVNSASTLIDTAGNVTQDGPITTSLLTITQAAAITLNNADNAIDDLGNIVHTGALNFFSDPGLLINSLISGNAPVDLVETGGNIVFGPNGQIVDSGAGNNVIVAAGTSLANANYIIDDSTAAGGAIVVSNGASAALFSSDPSNDVLGNLTFSQPDVYNATYTTTGLPPGTTSYFFAATGAVGPNAPGTNTNTTTNSTSTSNSSTTTDNTNNTQSQTTGQQNNSPQTPLPTGNNNNSDNDTSTPTPGSNTGNGNSNQTGDNSGNLANSSGSSGNIGSGDTAQLNDGQLNNVANPAASAALSQALSSAVQGNLANALSALNDFGAAGGTTTDNGSGDTTGGDNGSGTGTGTGNGKGKGKGNGNGATGGTTETIVPSGGAVTIGGSGVQTISPSQLPQQLQDALGNNVLNNMPPGTGN